MNSSLEKRKDGPYGQGNVPGKAVHRLCPNSLGCLLESGSPVSIGLIFPIPARPGLSGVRSTAGGVLACSPNVFPSVEAAPEVSFPHPEGLSVFGFAAKTFPGTNTTAVIAASTAIAVMYLMFIFKMITIDRFNLNFSDGALVDFIRQRIKSSILPMLSLCIGNQW